MIIQVFAYLRDICIACFYELPVHIHCSLKKRIGLLVFFLFPGALNIVKNLVLYDMSFEDFSLVCHLSFDFFVGVSFCHAYLKKIVVEFISLFYDF